MSSADPSSRPGAPGLDKVTAARVLVVDDSTAIRRILRRALEGADYLVEEAADGERAIAACRAQAPDLVLLDVDMPVMDGMATLAALRADDGLRSIPVVFLTARTGGTDVARGLDLGAQDYLRKPCDPVELVARVAAALRSSEREHGLERLAKEADEASATDPLTGLGNRRRLEAQTRILAARDGPDAVAGLLLVDVDHFKRINDEHGHLIGDVVLRILSRRLASALGPQTTLVRWGGEEFVALAPGLAGAPLAGLGEQLRASVAAEPFSVGVGALLTVTISVGCASGTLGRFEAMVEDADVALYDAKRSGRDRVSMASPHEPAGHG